VQHSPFLPSSQTEEHTPPTSDNLSPQPRPVVQGDPNDSTMQGYSARNKDLRNLGSIFTPPEFADYLTSWAIHDPRVRVLDLGIGDGAFVWSAVRRFHALGVLPVVAQEQIYGAEVYAPALTRLMEGAKRQGLTFPNLIHGNFLTLEFPEVDAIIGNPPYVRRQYLSDVDMLRRSISEKQPEVAKYSDSQLCSGFDNSMSYG